MAAAFAGISNAGRSPGDWVLSDFPTMPGTMTDLQQYTPASAHQPVHYPLRWHRKGSTLHPALLHLLLLTAAAAMMFMLIQCYRVLMSGPNPTSTLRRLADKGQLSGYCEVSCGGSLLHGAGGVVSGVFGCNPR